MKINSDVSSNFISCYDEARGVAKNKTKILKKKNNKCLTYLQTKLYIFMIMKSFGVLFIVKSDKNEDLAKIVIKSI